MGLGGGIVGGGELGRGVNCKWGNWKVWVWEVMGGFDGW